MVSATNTASPVEMTLTGCIDCGVVKAMSKDLPEVTQAGYVYGGLAVRMWRHDDYKHYMIVVQGKPQRVFLSCQPFSKLLTEEGVAAILNFVERIKEEKTK